MNKTNSPTSLPSAITVKTGTCSDIHCWLIETISNGTRGVFLILATTY